MKVKNEVRRNEGQGIDNKTGVNDCGFYHQSKTIWFAKIIIEWSGKEKTSFVFKKKKKQSSTR